MTIIDRLHFIENWKDKRTIAEIQARRDYQCSIGRHVNGSITMISPDFCGDPPLILQLCAVCCHETYYEYSRETKDWRKIPESGMIR